MLIRLHEMRMKRIGHGEGSGGGGDGGDGVDGGVEIGEGRHRRRRQRGSREARNLTRREFGFAMSWFWKVW